MTEKFSSGTNKINQPNKQSNKHTIEIAANKDVDVQTERQNNMI